MSNTARHWVPSTTHNYNDTTGRYYSYCHHSTQSYYIHNCPRSRYVSAMHSIRRTCLLPLSTCSTKARISGIFCCCPRTLKPSCCMCCCNHLSCMCSICPQCLCQDNKSPVKLGTRKTCGICRRGFQNM